MEFGGAVRRSPWTLSFDRKTLQAPTDGGLAAVESTNPRLPFSVCTEQENNFICFSPVNLISKNLNFEILNLNPFQQNETLGFQTMGKANKPIPYFGFRLLGADYSERDS